MSTIFVLFLVGGFGPVVLYGDVGGWSGCGVVVGLIEDVRVGGFMVVGALFGDDGGWSCD